MFSKAARNPLLTLFLYFILINTPVHELGHLAAANILRLQVTDIQLFWNPLDPFTSPHVNVQSVDGLTNQALVFWKLSGVAMSLAFLPIALTIYRALYGTWLRGNRVIVVALTCILVGQEDFMILFGRYVYFIMIVPMIACIFLWSTRASTENIFVARAIITSVNIMGPPSLTLTLLELYAPISPPLGIGSRRASSLGSSFVLMNTQPPP